MAKSIQDIKDKIALLRSVTPWEEIEDGAIYHIPPIYTLQRRDIRILSIKGDSASYRRIGDTNQEPRTMFKTSVFAKFLVKRKKF